MLTDSVKVTGDEVGGLRHQKVSMARDVLAVFLLDCVEDAMKTHLCEQEEKRI